MSSPLEECIEGACSPARYEPDLALNLEVCEMVNKKQGNAPREAAMAIVKHVNRKNLTEAMLGLTLLDNCVKNCGYPFHLQIATKEFLNELVRKFPERPVPFPNPVTQRILYLIKEWKVGLAEMSRHKDDLIHIKDMYRLLRFKGYRFPELRHSSVAALVAPSQNLRSPQELEDEDRVVQAAKLQELIRRGRPQDLVEANRLMKIMSGYDSSSAVNYQQKFEETLISVQDKAILLYEMLEKVTPDDNIERNDTISELKSDCISAQPKIQKMISEEEDDDKMNGLLKLNDMINNALDKWKDVKKGLFDTQYTMDGKPPTQNSSEEPRQAISLIDLDDVPSSSPAPSFASSTNVMDDLSGLFGQSLSVASPSTTPNSTGTPAKSSNPTDLFDMFGQQAPARSSPTTNNPSAASPTFSTTAGSVAAAPVSSAAHDSILLVHKNGLKIVLKFKKQNDTLWHFDALFSNESTAPMEDINLSLAVPKSMKLKLNPASSTTIPIKSSNAVQQPVEIAVNGEPLRLELLRLRYKMTYKQLDVPMEITGHYDAKEKASQA